MSFAEINQLLSQKSGDSAVFWAENALLPSLLAPDLDPEVRAIYDVYLYDIMNISVLLFHFWGESMPLFFAMRTSKKQTG